MYISKQKMIVLGVPSNCRKEYILETILVKYNAHEDELFFIRKTENR